MKEKKIITGKDIDEVWQKVSADMGFNELLLEYSVMIIQQSREILLEIDIDPGGGFESGYETTKISSRLQNVTDFKFAIHHQGFIDEIGKFFGMQDVITGNPEFDKEVIVKTNDEEKIKSLFSDENITSVFQDLANFTFHTSPHHVSENAEGTFLELNIEEGITDPAVLRKIYNAFYLVLIAIDA